MLWFPVPEIKDFVEGLEKGTIRKNNRSARGLVSWNRWKIVLRSFHFQD